MGHRYRTITRFVSTRLMRFLLDYGKKPTETLELYDYVEFMWWEMWWKGHFELKTVRIPPSPPS